jgi:hypothetical protein
VDETIREREILFVVFGRHLAFVEADNAREIHPISNRNNLHPMGLGQMTEVWVE